MYKLLLFLMVLTTGILALSTLISALMGNYSQCALLGIITAVMSILTFLLNWIGSIPYVKGTDTEVEEPTDKE